MQNSAIHIFKVCVLSAWLKIAIYMNYGGKLCNSDGCVIRILLCLKYMHTNCMYLLFLHWPLVADRYLKTN